MTNRPTPTCPNCNYDLTGLIEQGSSAACPECNTRSTFQAATTSFSRWRFIRLAAYWILIPPFITLGVGWIELNTTEILGFFAVLSLCSFIYLPTTCLLFILNERAYRNEQGQKNAKPSKRFVICSILFMTIVALTMSAATSWVGLEIAISI